MMLNHTEQTHMTRKRTQNTKTVQRRKTARSSDTKQHITLLPSVDEPSMKLARTRTPTGWRWGFGAWNTQTISGRQSSFVRSYPNVSRTKTFLVWVARGVQCNRDCVLCFVLVYIAINIIIIELNVHFKYCIQFIDSYTINNTSELHRPESSNKYIRIGAMPRKYRTAVGLFVGRAIS